MAVGGGYIAVEFAQIFHGYGSKVSLVYRGDQWLRGFDDDLRTHLKTEYDTAVRRADTLNYNPVLHSVCPYIPCRRAGTRRARVALGVHGSQILLP